MESKGYSVSVAFGDKTAEQHDRRDYTPMNAERGLQDRNVTILNCPDYAQAFNDFFAPAIDRYNERQTRADRKKSYDYYHDLIDGKEGYGKGRTQQRPIYEYVIQIGNRDDNGVTDQTFDDEHWRSLKKEGKLEEAEEYVMKHLNTSHEREELKQTLLDFGKELEKKYPHFKFFAIVYHDDEPNGTGHLHIAFAPYTDETKKGLDTRVSMSGALRQMGFVNDGGELAIHKWQNQVKDEITEKMNEAGYERQFMSNTEKHLSVPMFKHLQKVKEAEEKVEDIEQREAAVAEEEELQEISRKEYFKARSKVRDREQAAAARESDLHDREQALIARESKAEDELRNMVQMQFETLMRHTKAVETAREMEEADKEKRPMSRHDKLMRKYGDSHWDAVNAAWGKTHFGLDDDFER